MTKKVSKSESAEVNSPALFRETVGILFKNFVHCVSLGPHTHLKHFKKWHAGQIITNEAEIEMLLQMKAPIGVYYRDVDRTAKG
jgi:hypothetical protein